MSGDKQPWKNYTEITAWHDKHHQCPVCEAPSPGDGGMLCTPHAELWILQIKDVPSAYVNFINELRCPLAVLADSEWIANA